MMKGDRREPPPPLRHHNSAFFNTDDDDDDDAYNLPSPPYRRQASTSQVVDPPTSPPYESESMDARTAKSNDDHKHSEVADSDASRRPQDATVSSPRDNTVRKPSVHYLDDNLLHQGSAPSYQSPQRLDSGSFFSPRLSRAPSRADTDDDYEDDDDYDWSAEEDLVDEEAKFEKKMGGRKGQRGRFRRTLTLLFSTLLGSVFISGLLVTAPLLLYFYYYKPHPTTQRKYITDNVSAWLFWAAGNLLISWFLGFLVDLVPGLVRIVISIAWGHVSEYVKTRIEMYDSVKETLKPVLYSVSGWVSWIILFESIYKLYNPNDEGASRAPYTIRVYQAIEFLFFLALVICAQRMVSHAIAFAFHRVAYQERIDSLSEALKVIEALRNYKPKRMGHRTAKSTPVIASMFGADHYFERARRSGTPDPVGVHDSGADGDSSDDEGDKKHKKHQKKKEKKKGRERGFLIGRKQPKDKDKTKGELLRHGSPALPDSEPVTPMNVCPPLPHSSNHQYPPVSAAIDTNPERLATPGAVSGRRTPAADSDEGEAVVMQAARVLGKAVLHDARNIKGKEGSLSGLMWNVNSAHEAKRLARAIYRTFKDRHRSFLIPADFIPAFPDKETSQKAFRVFDKDNNGDISRAEIKTTLLKVYKERRLLSRSMRDVGIALKTLDQILLFFAFAVLFFISLSVFNVNVDQSLTSLYTLFIGASFIFKNAASSAFDAVMFLFVSHPFDTGDRCFVDDENFVVKKMGLFATIFTRADGTETYYFNSILFTKFIINARRSGKTFENLTMQVAWRTPLEKLDALEKCMNEWLQTEENRWFEPSTSITFQHIDFQRFLEVTIGIGHNGYDLADWGLRMQRKTTFHAAVQFYCRQLGITCYDSPRPIVWGNNDTGDYMPLTPMEDENPPASPGIGSVNEPPLDQEQAKEMKTALGFLPPVKDRSNLRARKSKNKRAVLRSTGADGGGGG